MTRWSARYSDRYSGGGSVAVGDARQDVYVDTAVDVDVDVAKTPPADAAPQRGALSSNTCTPALSVVTKLTQVEQVTTDRAKCEGRGSSSQTIAENLGKRHEVVRTGERAPIPGYVRSAVWYRDGGRCVKCSEDGMGDGSVIGKSWHLDHIVPWSAGGSDNSTNLRVLCERHNMERSNFYDLAEARPKRPVTWWCVNCFSPDVWAGWRWWNGIPIICPVDHGFGCRVIGGFDRALRLNGKYPEPWHERPPIEAETGTIAYCAHCDAPGVSEVLL